MGKNPNSTYASVTLDDSNFNDCVNLSEFESDQTLSYIPLDREFDVLSYRMTGEFRVPFRVFPAIEEISATVLEILLCTSIVLLCLIISNKTYLIINIISSNMFYLLFLSEYISINLLTHCNKLILKAF